MHAPESPNTCWNRTLLGTLLDYWNLAGTLLQPCWKVAQILPQPCWSRARTLLEPCWSPASWNLAGKSLELCWNFSGSWCWNMVKPCWNLAGTSGWNILLETNAGVDFVFLFTLLLFLMCRVVRLEVWLELCWSRVATLLLLEPIWGQLLDFLGVFLLWWRAIKDDDPLLKLWCWNPCLNLWMNLCWNPGMNLALQGSKVARSRGKVPSLHQDHKDAGCQGSRICSRLQGSKI